jgi:hypothetical protein
MNPRDNPQPGQSMPVMFLNWQIDGSDSPLPGSITFCEPPTLSVNDAMMTAEASARKMACWSVSGLCGCLAISGDAAG